MGILGSKCKVKVIDPDIGENIRYQKLNNVADDDQVRNKEAKVRESEQSDRLALRNDSSSWDAVFTGINHTGECKHSKSLSLTTQVSPKSTTTTDGDDVQSVSTLTSMLENPLLKRVKPDSPLYRRADGELRPVGPVHPWKLGKDKNQVRLELEEKGLIKNKTAEEEIIGDLRNVGIISHNTSNDSISLSNELNRRLPARLAHLPLEATKAQTTKVADDNFLRKPKINADPVFSKSEVGFEPTPLQSVIEEKVEEMVSSGENMSSDEKENHTMTDQSEGACTKNGNDVIELKIKLIDTEIL